MFVEMLSYTSGKRVVMAEIRVVEGAVVISAPLPPAIKDTIQHTWERARGNEALFLQYLPNEFSGAYVRAKLVL